MGYIKHQHIIVTGWESKERDAMLKWVAEKGWQEWISVSEVMTNGYWSAIIWADGSKEGWDESDQGNARRNEFVSWCRKNVRWHQMAYVTFDEYDERGEETKQWIYESDHSKQKVPLFE